MNKYLGFYQLKTLSLPAVPWKQFTPETKLDEKLLWTVRVAVEDSSDLNLPRLIGANSDEASRKGRELLDMYSGRGLILYYPYFIAEKSGVMDINNSRIVIEAVDKDLWNLVTCGRKNVTIVISSTNENEISEYHGDRSFLSPDEICEIRRHAAVIKGKFRDDLSEGSSVLAEWSFAFNTDIGNKPIGHRYLVFYELRTVK
ncbi:MAG: hypothetical protein FIA99_18550 [Ruminiclostridium sp.]|nr:hypothetical protein [Ruminiclostridium sp.]